MRNIFTPAIAVIVPIIVLTACVTQEMPKAEAPAVTGDFEVSVLKTGKSDAIVLRSGEETAVIDCGEKDDGDKVTSFLNSEGIDTIDHLFITHFDKDHVGGAAYVVSNMNIGQTVVPPYEGDSDEYEAFIDAENERGYTLTTVTEGYTFTMGDALFEVYPPHRGKYDDNDNDFSIVIKVTHGNDTMLFCGDSEQERVNEILSYDIESDFIKIPHHGVFENNTPELIEKVKPKYAVITCTEKHPADDETLDALDDIGCETFLTEDGTVNVVSTGNGIEITQ